MRIVRIRAGSVKEAVERLKRELGSDAVVISTRTVWERDGLKKRRRIEVAAAVEREVGAELPSSEAYPSQEIADDLRSEIVNLSAMVEQLRESWDRAQIQVLSDMKERVARLEYDMTRLYDSFHKLARAIERAVDEMFPMPPNSDEKTQEVLTETYEKLLQSGLHPSLARRWTKELADELNSSGGSDPDVAENKALEFIARKLIDYAPPCEPSKIQGFRNLVLIGPSGTGKTTTLAKLIVDWAERGAKPAVAFAQKPDSIPLDSLLQPFGLDAVPVEGWEEMRRWLLNQEVPTVLDLRGISPRERSDVERLTELCSSAELDVHLCLPASLSFSDAVWFVEEFKRFNPKSVILTKLDECKSPAGVLQGLAGYGLPLSVFTTGRDIPRDLEAATPERLAAMILGLI